MILTQRDCRSRSSSIQVRQFVALHCVVPAWDGAGSDPLADAIGRAECRPKSRACPTRNHRARRAWTGCRCVRDLGPLAAHSKSGRKTSPSTCACCALEHCRDVDDVVRQGANRFSRDLDFGGSQVVSFTVEIITVPKIKADARGFGTRATCVPSIALMHQQTFFAAELLAI